MKRKEGEKMKKGLKVFVLVSLWLFFIATVGFAGTIEVTGGSFTLSSIVKPGETGETTVTIVIKDIEKPTDVVFNGESLKRQERDSNGNLLRSWDTLITKYTVNGQAFDGDTGNHIVATVPAGGEATLTIKVEATSHPISWGSGGPSDDAGEYTGCFSITLIEK